MEFNDFFAAVNDKAPFPWQERLAMRLREGLGFSVDVPTGLGKSSVLDAAVWAALQGGWRRIVFIVDRRLVVDEAYERAMRVKHALLHSRALAQCASVVGEMQVVRLRGGLFGDDDWVLYPDRLTVVLSTVDQVGSRLLNRGYGVSPRRWPLHTGFFSSRTLLILDEAHLSTPFLHTVQTIKQQGADITVIPMSATLSAKDDDALSLSDADFGHPVIAQRLGASKLAQLVECAGNDADLSRVAIKQAARLGLDDNDRKLAVIVNRVALARSIYEKLHANGHRCILLIGRSRPYDRDKVLVDYLPELKSGRQRTATGKPLCVVATQTVEVGADFDFDALVTEAASLSALRQRFGRQDRLGTLGVSQAVILYRGAKVADPVYGDQLTRTWEWLNRVADQCVVDMGILALDNAIAAMAPPVAEVAAHATLLPVHLHLLGQSGPFAPQLDVSAWLHGARRQEPEVSLVWRSDLHASTDLDKDALEANWRECVAVMPPLRREALDMPASTIRRWLNGHDKPDTELSDLDAEVTASTGHDEPDRWVLRWRGAEDCVLIRPGEIRPGDTLIVPASHGGCDQWGWAPQSTKPVTDLAEACRFDSAGNGNGERLSIRLWPERCRQFSPPGNADLAESVALLMALLARAKSGEDVGDDLDVAQQRLRDIVTESSHPWLRALGKHYEIESYPSGIVLRGRGVEEVMGALEGGVEVTLDVHHKDVERWALRLASAHPDVELIGRAGAIHDAGKQEPRMQHVLHGNAASAEAGPPLAKSGLRSRSAQLAAYRESGFPRGFRHEMASLEYVVENDPMTRHLVGTHHGFGRPWFPQCADANAVGVSLGTLASGWNAQFASLLAEHGMWSLAQREWLLRAADARASIEESNRDGKSNADT